MARCSCSTRALEIVIRDLTGTAITPRRAQRQFAVHRNFGTRPNLRQLATGLKSESVDVEPNFVGSAIVETNTETDLDAASAKTILDGVTASFPGAGEGRHADVEHPSKRLEASDKPAEVVAGDTGPEQPISRFERRRLRKLQRIQDGKSNRTELSDGAARWYEARKENTLRGLPTRHTTQQIGRRTEGDLGIATGSAEIADENESEHVEVNGDGDDAAQALPIKSKTGPHPPIKQQPPGRNTQTTEQKANESAKRDTREQWQIQKSALERKFGEESWQPRKRVSPDTLEGIRALHASDPATYPTEVLAQHFEITSEAVRRILKSKWKPNAEEIDNRTRRWERRGIKKWEDMSEQGLKPPKKWRAMGVPNPHLEAKKKWDGQRGFLERKREGDSAAKVSRSKAQGLTRSVSTGGWVAERIL